MFDGTKVKVIFVVVWDVCLIPSVKNMEYGRHEIKRVVRGTDGLIWIGLDCIVIKNHHLIMR